MNIYFRSCKRRIRSAVATPLRKRIVGNAGQCLTNQEAIDIMEEQERIKRIKLSDKVFDKKMMEENKL